MRVRGIPRVFSTRRSRGPDKAWSPPHHTQCPQPPAFSGPLTNLRRLRIYESRNDLISAFHHHRRRRDQLSNAHRTASFGRVDGGRIAYRGVECAKLDEGYAPVVSAVDSTGLSLWVAASVIRSLQDDLLAERIETGVSTTDSTTVIVDIACRGVELVGKFLVVAARWRGFGGRERQE